MCAVVLYMCYGVKCEICMSLVYGMMDGFVYVINVVYH